MNIMLPTIEYPIIKLPVPSKGITVKARPFTVKEEKLLLIAATGKDASEIIQTTQQVIRNCLLEDVDVESLPFFDIDLMFITLRSKSISEKIEMEFRCKHDLGEKVCGAVFPVALDLSATTLTGKTMNPKIELSSKLGLKMRYPTYAEMKRVSTLNDEIELILACIEYIYDDTTIYTSKDYTKEQYKDFVEKLTSDQYSKISEWTSNFPTFQIQTESVCPSCGFNHKIKYSDFTSFFQ
tara:strand:- start:4434 stop:5147 length:714 start_codon:yes stop_codon:yes gene_type:complete